MPRQQPGAIHAPTQHTSQHAAMLTFLDRLSGRRRHVRRAAETTPATPTPSVELPEEAASRLRSDERLTCQQTEEGRASEERIEELCALRLTGRCDSSATTSMHHRRYQRHGRGQTQSCPHGDTIQGQHRHHAYSQLRPSSCKLELPRCRIHPYLTTLLLLLCTLCGIADACSSRSTPRPRPPTPSPRPNITFHTYSCPPDYAEWYCLNGASCFTVKIVDSLLYNCLCPNGYIGQRCEFKDLDGSYLPSRQRVMLETASIAGGATIAVFLVVIICIAAYIHCKRKQKELRTSSNCVDTVDGPARDPERRPFTNRSRSLVIFMTKNSNSSLQPAVK